MTPRLGSADLLAGRVMTPGLRCRQVPWASMRRMTPVLGVAFPRGGLGTTRFGGRRVPGATWRSLSLPGIPGLGLRSPRLAGHLSAPRGFEATPSSASPSGPAGVLWRPTPERYPTSLSWCLGGIWRPPSPAVLWGQAEPRGFSWRPAWQQAGGGRKKLGFADTHMKGVGFYEGFHLGLHTQWPLGSA